MRYGSLGLRPEFTHRICTQPVCAVHHIAARYKLTTASVGEGFDRHVVVTFNPDCELCVAAVL